MEQPPVQPEQPVFRVGVDYVTAPVLVFDRDGNYVDPTTGGETSLGAFKLVSCLASPYVPVGQGGAPGGLQYNFLVVSLSRATGSVEHRGL